MRVADVVGAVLMLAIAGVVAFELRGAVYWDDFAPGPAFMPYWMAGFAALIAVLLLVATLRPAAEGPAGNGADADAPDFSDLKPAGAVMLLLWALLGAMPWLGLLPGAALFILLVLVGLLRCPLKPSLVSALITVALIYTVFQRWLEIDLPQGVLGGVFGGVPGL